MPTRNQIQEIIHGTLDRERRGYLKKMHRRTKRATVLYATAFSMGNPLPSSLLSLVSDDIQGFMAAFHGVKEKELDLILHSPGGSVEAAEQLVNYMRNKFTHIRVFVPQMAMSAATMIACAADEIVMGKQSAIGPIDPQITYSHERGQTITLPAQDILDEFEQAQESVMKNPKTAAIWIPKLQKIPHGLLSYCKTAQKLAEEKVEVWLKDYMKLSPPQAASTSQWLANAKEHKTHGRPISISLAKDHHLKVNALEDDQSLQELVLSIFHATAITFENSKCVKFFENHLGKGLYRSVR